VDEQLLALKRMIRRHTYDPADLCIYCGADGGAPGGLTVEHIIPESLGGTLLLPSSSCRACAVATSAIEGRAGQLFRPARRQLGLPQKGRGRKRREETAKEVYRLTIGDGKRVDVPVRELPGLLLSFWFDMPEVLFGLQPDDRPLDGGVSLSTLPGFEGRLAELQAAYKTDRVKIHQEADAEMVGRLLAKIAHAYAIAELGTNSFKPRLLNAIFERAPMYLRHYVGSGTLAAPTGQDLHEIGIDDTGLGDGRHVVVRIQLFANRAFPVHYVVVGEHV
jgi:hypothetical protein